jgi:hypothetical protein
MKRIFTLLLSSIFSLSLLAYDGSRLSISTIGNDKVDFKVEVDGRRFNMKDNSVTLSNLSEGNHNVRIFRVKRNGTGRKQELIYATSVFLRRGFHLDITVNRFGKALVDERKIDRYDDWFDEGYDDYYEDEFADVMTAQEFQQVKQSISKEWLESNKLSSAKFIIDKNFLSTAQVRELMTLFAFEKNKLELAKYAYRKTVDKHNYYQVSEQLSFSSSREELAKFMRESR